MRTLTRTVALLLVAWVPANAMAGTVDTLDPQDIGSVRIQLNSWGAHLGFEREYAGDDPGVEALLEVIRGAEPGGDHRCSNAGSIRFRMKDGAEVVVGLLPGHVAGLYGLRRYDGDAYLGAHTVDRPTLLRALGNLGVPLDDPAFRAP